MGKGRKDYKVKELRLIFLMPKPYFLKYEGKVQKGRRRTKKSSMVMLLMVIFEDRPPQDNGNNDMAENFPSVTKNILVFCGSM